MQTTPSDIPAIKLIYVHAVREKQYNCEREPSVAIDHELSIATDGSLTTIYNIILYLHIRLNLEAPIPYKWRR